MRVGVGVCENPDTVSAGTQAARMALSQGGTGRCDLVLLFSTSRHDAGALRRAVAAVLGAGTPIFGGGALGVISNDYFGYAGDQVGLAAFWLEGGECRVFAESGLRESEENTGRSLGRSLSGTGVGADSPVLLFYDAFDCTGEKPRMLMATPLLKGIEEGLGFLPRVLGTGMQGDYLATPIKQWIGGDLAEHHAMALLFDKNLRIDDMVMHGCRPGSGYYTVTRAERQVILEINGQPALKFLRGIFGSALSPEEFPFFLTFGINNGERWGEFNEEKYASRLVLAIDKARDGIVMFEPDMVEGTSFQIMHRSMNLAYIKPKIDRVFAGLGGRKPVFALYINCGGRAAGYGGMDLEDAYVVQDSVAGKAPLLGIYSGVEIAPVDGRSRALDLSGVFCLFSVAAEDGDSHE